MVFQTFHIPSVDWLVNVFYEVEKKDAARVMGVLDDMGFRGDDLASAEKMLRRGEPNQGFTISNSRERCSVIVMTWTTSADQFANTFDHEKRHLAIHISDVCGMDVRGEEYAYLAGSIAQRMFGIARKFLCECCRRKQRITT